MPLQPIINAAPGEVILDDYLLRAFTADHSLHGLKAYAFDLGSAHSPIHVRRFMK
jgi:hypothetical protein